MYRKLLLISLFLLMPDILLATVIGTVSNTSGEVLFRGGDNQKYGQIRQKQPLEEGNWVKTGKKGWLEINLVDGSRFTVANNSELELTSFLVSKEKKEGSFTLTQGKIRASVVKLAGQQTDIKI